VTVAYGSPVFLLVAATHGELCGRDGLVCGVGPVEAAAATARALALRPFEAVLHVGLAGGRELEPGTVVVGSEAVYCDLSAEWPVIERSQPDHGLVERALVAVPGAVSLPIHTSAEVGRACDTVSQGPLVEAMEGFGVLRAAELAAVPAVEVRVVSNEIGEPDRTRWEIAQALEVLATTILALLPTFEQSSG
jgi:nucleoside phosphorylase